MTAVFAKILTDLFMIVLCTASAPSDQKEIQIDVVRDQGCIETMIIQREEIGFTVYKKTDGKRIKFATIVPKDAAKNSFIFTSKAGTSVTISLEQAIQNFNLSDLKTKPTLLLKTNDGETIKVKRSKNLLFLSPSNLKCTYIVH